MPNLWPILGPPIDNVEIEEFLKKSALKIRTRWEGSTEQRDRWPHNVGDINFKNLVKKITKQTYTLFLSHQ